LKFLVTLEHGDDGWIAVECPALPGCLSQGRTIDEALANIREVIELSLETRQAEGIPTAIEVAEVEVESPHR
jgi:predicted RNase H-like HicB family nuclease